MRFLLTVLRNQESLSERAYDAADAAGACRQAEAHGFRVIAARRVTGRFFFDLGAWFVSPGARFSVSLFCQELLALLDAGLGLVESLALLAPKARREEVRQVLADLRRQVAEGHSFASALANATTVFPPLFVAAIKSAERTGSVSEALRRYSAHHRQLNALRETLVAAAVYPLLLVGVALVVVVFLLAYIVPRFSRIYEDIGRDHLPLLSRGLMQWGAWVGDSGLEVGVGIAFALAVTGAALFQPSVRMHAIRIGWRLPVIGEQLRLYPLARLTRTVAMLLKGGVPLVAALDMCDDLLGQVSLRQGLADARAAIRAGRSVADTFSQYGLATDVGVRLLVVGERSGDLGEIMERIAAFYEDEIRRTVDRISRLFEPVLMLFIGALIGGIVILMYLPIFELAGSLQ